MIQRQTPIVPVRWRPVAPTPPARMSATRRLLTATLLAVLLGVFGVGVAHLRASGECSNQSYCATLDVWDPLWWWPGRCYLPPCMDG